MTATAPIRPFECPPLRPNVPTAPDAGERAALVHGDDLHRFAIWTVREALRERGWRMTDPRRLFAGLEEERIPDVIADGEISWTRPDGTKARRMIRLIVEVETRRRRREMAARERFYTDTWPPRADRFVVIPLWELGRRRDSIRALRDLVLAYLP